MTPDIAGYLNFRPHFARVIEPQDMAKLDAIVCAEKAQVWTGDNAAVVTEVLDDGQPYLSTLAAGGDIEEITLRLRPRAEEWGKQQGCIYAFVNGRKGWRRVFAPYGYTPFRDGIRKDL